MDEPELARFAVLVVEDDLLLLTEAVDLVEEAGFTAYEARNAAQAIFLLEKHPDIRVLFTDIHMPGSMDGLKLARAVTERWPPVRIMVTSGLKGVGQQDVPKNGQFFSKPYPPMSVIRELNRLAADIHREAAPGAPTRR